MKKIYFAQLNNIIADATFLPLSIGYIWEYCKSQKDIMESWELGGIFFEREPISKILDNIKDPDVLAISCYVWNWEISKNLASKIKKLYPKCLIVLGGPHPPYNRDWLIKNSYVDLLVAYSGEYAFADILRGKENIPGVFSKTYSYVEPEPITDLDTIPSPYLSGLMNSLMREGKKYSAIIETNRGCPYKCTFCDQESNYYNKIYKFNYDRVIKELDWVSSNKIEFMYFADSNLGIFDRDLEFIKKIAANRNKTGYPRQIDYATAKQQPDRIVELGKILNQEANIKRGVTIALQSMNPKTLSAIKRINVANSKLEQIIKKYNDAGIENYCEIILGLPEESFQSWIGGISKILELGSDHALTMHPLSVVPNTPFGERQYKSKYNLTYVKTKAPAGSNFDERFTDEEYDFICCSSNTMNREEWVECYFFTKGIVIPHHYHGVSQVVAEYLYKIHKIPMIDYYMSLYQYSKNSKGILNKEYLETVSSVNGSLDNKKFWGRKIFESSYFHFQDNAATSSVLYLNIDSVHKEISELVFDNFSISINEVLLYNKLILNTFKKDTTQLLFSKNYDSWFKNDFDLVDCTVKVEVEPKHYIDIEKHAKDLFWFGRKSKRCYLSSKETPL